ncbi:MAG: ribosomal protein S19 family protein [Candidatus Micrarchaeia archaeon]
MVDQVEKSERIIFKGMTATQLSKLSDEEYIKLVDSRMRRSILRKGLKYKALIEKVKKYKEEGKTKNIRVHEREAVILPSWIGMVFEVHNGKQFSQITITPAMLGHRLGEFVYSTKRVVHSAPGIKATRGSKFLSVK